MDLNAKLAEINTLSVDDRLWLAHAIWDGIPEGDRIPGLTDEQAAELDRRIAEAEANPDIGVPWREAMARIRGTE